MGRGWDAITGRGAVGFKPTRSRGIVSSAGPPKATMPYFDEDTLRRLRDGFDSVPARAQALTETFLGRAYLSVVAKEHAHHGVCRRLATLARCISQIYALLPPERDEVPVRDVLVDATIFIQAFVFNAYGVLDNLAFVWVNEKNVRKSDGQPLPNGRIGLTSDKEQVRLSFSPEMQTYLAGRDAWLANLENFRHSLGHRIPLYIPPYIVSPANLPLYEELESRMDEALFRRSDLADYQRLKVEQQALTRFRPWMKHSFEDPTPPIVFHPQLLADFATVEEMSKRILAELDRQTAR
jgi:hypothetical protein